MKPHAEDGMTTRHRRRTPAFSLAELMIALAVLGMGLLVIGAALPAGVKFTKRSVDQATADATAEYALTLIEKNVCLRKQVLDSTGTTLIASAPLFQPRGSGDTTVPGDPPPGYFFRGYEPLVKVRPLLTQNVCVGGAGGGTGWPANDEMPEDEGYLELAVASWVDRAGLTQYDPEGKEYDFFPQVAVRPSISVLDAVYPPVGAVYTPAEAGNDGVWDPHDFFRRPYDTAGSMAPELDKVRKRNVAWIAFYRRVSYASGSDPGLYEFVIVVTRLPSDGHFYVMQDTSTAGNPNITAVPRSQTGYGQVNCAVPLPWLVSFTALPPSPAYVLDSEGRRMLQNPPTAGTLRFEASAEVGQLMPPRSIFIPALNDVAPTGLNMPMQQPPLQNAGFIPSAPDVLPIYEVTEQVQKPNGKYDIVVKHNGFYPWLGTVASSPAFWPVWVIPPAVSEIDSQGKPVYSNQSPILGVYRRYIRLHEVD